MQPEIGSFAQYLYFVFSPTLLYRDSYPRCVWGGRGGGGGRGEEGRGGRGEKRGRGERGRGGKGGITFFVLSHSRSPDQINIKNVIIYFLHVRTLHSGNVIDVTDCVCM